jgi:hypothetical protein
VATLGEFAFSSCSALVSICIPISVQRIGWFCFRNCANLSSVVCGAEWTVSRLENIGFPVISPRPEFFSREAGSESVEDCGCLYIQ